MKKSEVLDQIHEVFLGIKFVLLVARGTCKDPTDSFAALLVYAIEALFTEAVAAGQHARNARLRIPFPEANGALHISQLLIINFTGLIKSFLNHQSTQTL